MLVLGLNMPDAQAGIFHYNPKRGATPLRPLSTEGQDLPGGPEKTYGLFAMSNPYGLEFEYIISRVYKSGINAGVRPPSRSCIDNASTVYYDNDVIRANKGDLAAELADRTTGELPTWSSPGAPRGNPESNDTFFTLMVKWTYAPFSKSSGRKRNRAQF